MLVTAEIREPHAALSAAAGRFRGTERALHRRCSAAACVVLGKSVVAAWRGSDSSRARPVRYAGVTIVVLPAEGDVLAGHVIECERRIPGLERISRISRKVWRIERRRCGRLSVDGRDEDKIASGIVDLAAAERHRKTIFLEPCPVVEHVANETLLGSRSGRILAAGVVATHSAAEFTA